MRAIQKKTNQRNKKSENTSSTQPDLSSKSGRLPRDANEEPLYFWIQAILNCKNVIRFMVLVTLSQKTVHWLETQLVNH